METRTRILGFHALKNRRFVKIDDNKHVEICDDTTSIRIEVVSAPANFFSTGVIEVEENKIIVVFSANNNYESLLALLDLSIKSCVSTEKLHLTPSFFSLIHNNTILVIPKDYSEITFYSFKNNELKWAGGCNPAYKIQWWAALPGTKIVLYATNLPQLYKIDDHNHSSITKLIIHHHFWSTKIKGLVALTPDSIVCWSNEGKKYYLQFMDTYGNLHSCVKLSKNPFDQMVALNDQFVAMIAKRNSVLYVEAYNRHGEKVAEVEINNRSDQLFSVTPDGILISCSRSGDLTVHNLCLQKFNEEYLAIKTAITRNSNISMEAPAKLICDYLGFFSQKQTNTQETIYSNDKIKKLVPGF